MPGKRTAVAGIGINDADYMISPRVNGKQVLCPIYALWAGMIKRCYDKKSHIKRPNYAECSVCDEWLTFSNFKVWMEKQDWQGKHLDKDLLVVGNKVYSPETCVFVSALTNTFTLDRSNDRGDWPLGVHWSNKGKTLKAQCNNPFTKKRECLGSFDDKNEAHLAWKRRKHELACQLADLQTDKRVAAALRSRYL